MSNFRIDWPRALGEILIIVIGVLTALAVDEWRNERQDRELEAAYLARLQVDLERDVDAFTSELSTLEKKAAFLQSLIDKTTEQQFLDNPEALMKAKVVSSFRGAPAIVRTTFDELQSTGRLALIRDVRIRSALSEYYAAYAAFVDQINAASLGEYPDLVNGVVPGNIAREWRLSGTISNPSGFLLSLRQLERHPDLPTAANIEISYASALQFYLTESRQQAISLLHLLDERSVDNAVVVGI